MELGQLRKSYYLVGVFPRVGGLGGYWVDVQGLEGEGARTKDRGSKRGKMGQK